jgi:hypothetical protein
MMPKQIRRGFASPREGSEVGPLSKVPSRRRPLNERDTIDVTASGTKVEQQHLFIRDEQMSNRS